MIPVRGALYATKERQVEGAAGYFNENRSHIPVLPVTELDLDKLEPFSRLRDEDWIFYSSKTQAYRLQVEVMPVSEPAVVSLQPIPTFPSTPERDFMRLAIEEARKCKPEDGRVHPFVGVVVVKEGHVIASAHRGETGPGEHAEYVALEKKLAGISVAGATIYTTLEPCTTRTSPKKPCVEHIRNHRIKRVVIGTLDPDKSVHGAGELQLREAQIEVARFDAEYMAEIEELNRAFIESRRKGGNSPPKEPLRVELRSAFVEKPTPHKSGYDLFIVNLNGRTIDDGRLLVRVPPGFGIARPEAVGGWYGDPSPVSPKIPLLEPLHRGDPHLLGRLRVADLSKHKGSSQVAIQWTLTGRDIEPVEGSTVVDVGNLPNMNRN